MRTLIRLVICYLVCTGFKAQQVLCKIDFISILHKTCVASKVKAGKIQFTKTRTKFTIQPSFKNLSAEDKYKFVWPQMMWAKLW